MEAGAEPKGYAKVGLLMVRNGGIVNFGVVTRPGISSQIETLGLNSHLGLRVKYFQIGYSLNVGSVM